MYEIPTSVVLNGINYPIRNKGDYRTILDILVTLEDEELTANERVIASLIIFYEDINSFEDILLLQDIKEAVGEMYRFINCGQEESPGMNVNHKVIDWKTDSQLICSAINKVANTEVRAIPYMHWWTFMGYYLAVGESALSTVVSIRSKILKGKKLEKYEQEFRRNNPKYFNWNSRTVQQREADELVKQMWNSGE